jgi:hypothetical protein
MSSAMLTRSAGMKTRRTRARHHLPELDGEEDEAGQSHKAEGQAAGAGLV